MSKFEDDVSKKESENPWSKKHVLQKPPKFSSTKLKTDKFSLDLTFMHQMSKEKTPWDSDIQSGKPENVLSALVYYRTYSRNGQPWFRCVQRVVEGTFHIQQQHFASLRKKWNSREAQKCAQDMYRRIFNAKFLPPGRGLWAMGTSIVEEKGLAAALNNCAFTSTKNIDKYPTDPFTFLMDASMLGVGVGLDTKGAGKLKIFEPLLPGETFVIQDSREGWVNSVKMLITSYARNNRQLMHFDYSMIRKEGVPLKTFGGISSGPGPLVKLHEDLRKTFSRYVGNYLDSRGIADVCNQIGLAVMSGNIRRSAEILFGEADDDIFINLKNYDRFPERKSYGWTSNNSVFAKLGMDYSDISERIRHNGEPGLFWLENARAYSRMMETEKDYKDHKVCGANPCNEQSLEDGEMCCLVETFPNHHENLKDFLDTLRSAFMYAKTVSLLPTHWERSNDVMLRNRRIGTSVSGITQFLADHTMETFKEWLVTGYAKIQDYDKELSDYFCVPRSIKTTTVKPSGTVSLLAGATPGINYPISNYYIRRVTLAHNSIYAKQLQEAGYKVEISSFDPNYSVVAELPVCIGKHIKCQKDVSMWEQLSLAAFLQKYWSDNQVSATITFDKEKEGPHIHEALNYFQYQLKGVAMFPSVESRNKYKIKGEMKNDHMKEELRRLELSEIVKVKYEKSDDATWIFFDPDMATDAMCKSVIEKCKDLGYVVEAKVDTPYKQIPYEPITEEMYFQIIASIKPVKWDNSSVSYATIKEEGQIPAELQYCDGDSCVF